MTDPIRQDDARLLDILSCFLNSDPAAIKKEAVLQLAAECEIGEDEAYIALLGAYCGLDASDPDDARLCRGRFPKMLRRVDPALCLSDPYTLAVGMPEGQEGSLRLVRHRIRPMELFVCGDFIYDRAGRLLPQLGWCSTELPYLELEEGGRTWMTVTPNEIVTLRPLAEKSHGRVLCYGLGLGYYVFHALLRPEVEKVTVVERSPEVIALFRKHLLPHFPRRKDLEIMQDDAFTFAGTRGQNGLWDTVLCDLWHDAGDGLPLYQRMKRLEIPGPDYLYWIEPTIRYYIDTMRTDAT